MNQLCTVEARQYDLRRERTPSRPEIRMRRGQVVELDPSKVDAITIHQTAVEFGLDRHGRMLRAAGGNRELALARRSLNTACHALAFRGGFFATPTPLLWYVQHANRLNATTLCLEVDGRYAGCPDNPRTIPRREDLESTWGGEPSELTADTIRAACAALQWLVDEGRALGMDIRKVYAHRQSSRSRRSDPGWSIWEHVVEGYAIPVLGLEPDYDFTIGSGRPIPAVWSGEGTERY